MNQIVKWVLLGVLAYLILLIAKMPANQLISRISLPANVAVSGVDGTIWDGTASSVIVSNIAIEKLHWDTSFFALFLGRLSLDLDAGNIRASDKVSIEGNVAISLFDQKHIRANDLTAYLPADMVIGRLPLPVAVDMAGRFKVELDELNYPAMCYTLAGTGQWLNASLDGLNEPANLGTFNADLSCVDNDILVVVKEPNVFGLSANTRIKPDFKYTVDGQFKLQDDLPQQIKEASAFFGRPNSQGYTEFTL